MEDAEELLAAVLAWARVDERVEAVVQTGSRGRGSRVDAFSDLDLELIGSRWRELADDPDWSAGFAPELVSVRFDDESSAARLVVYRQGRKIDFTLAGPERLASELDDLYQRGYRVLLDRTGITAGLPPASGAAPVPARPERAEFDRTVAEFWFEATQVPVYLARGDLWVAKFRDNTMKECLLRMLEWHAATEPGGPPDVWHIGHHLDEWLPEHLWRGVRDCFGRFDAADSHRALLATTAVFHDASTTVATRCAFPPRPDLADQVTTLIHRLAGGED